MSRQKAIQTASKKHKSTVELITGDSFSFVDKPNRFRNEILLNFDEMFLYGIYLFSTKNQVDLNSKRDKRLNH